MKSIHSLYTALLGSALLPAFSQAADLNARDFFSAPAGTQLSVLYLSASRASDYHGAANTNGNAELDVNAMYYRHVFFTDICGTLCTPQFIIPVANIDARLPGALDHTSESGLGDPAVGGTVYFINDPQSRTYSGLLTLLSLPVGEYHSRNPDVSPGTNRWRLDLNYNYTQGMGDKWVLEGNIEAQLYGKNNDYYGGDLEQKPMYRAQAFASYDFTSSTYGAIKLVYANGGELSLNDRTLDDTRQRYTQLGFEVGHWFDRQNQVMVSFLNNVDTDNGYHGSQALLRLVHAF
ncbi:UNVERIFIED_ORG: hypothetical protein J2W87_003234 [Pseudomonas putida]|nr:hypothetical protein [Pseudomonas putida]